MTSYLRFRSHTRPTVVADGVSVIDISTIDPIFHVETDSFASVIGGTGERAARRFLFTVAGATLVTGIDLRVGYMGVPQVGRTVVVKLLASDGTTELASDSVAETDLEVWQPMDDLDPIAPDLITLDLGPQEIAAGSYYIEVSRPGTVDASNRPSLRTLPPTAYAGSDVETLLDSGVWGELGVFDMEFRLF